MAPEAGVSESLVKALLAVLAAGTRAREDAVLEPWSKPVVLAKEKGGAVDSDVVKAVLLLVAKEKAGAGAAAAWVALLLAAGVPNENGRPADGALVVFELFAGVPNEIGAADAVVLLGAFTPKKNGVAVGAAVELAAEGAGAGVLLGGTPNDTPRLGAGALVAGAAALASAPGRAAVQDIHLFSVKGLYVEQEGHCH
jgi:hypothetical protein